MQCSAVQCSAVQCSAVQCCAVQCSAVQCSAVQSNAEQESKVNCCLLIAFCVCLDNALLLFCLPQFVHVDLVQNENESPKKMKLEATEKVH